MCRTPDDVKFFGRAKLGAVPEPKPTDRERKLRFIRSFGRHALETAISEAVCRAGADNFLTDEQLDDIVSEQVKDARAENHRRLRNRRAARHFHDTEDRSSEAAL